jgi:homocitrate synthase
MTDAQYKECTVKLKALGDIRPLTIDDGDSIISAFHQSLKAGTDGPLLKTLSVDEQAQLEETEKELNKVPEKRELDETVEEEVETERLVKKAKMAA